MAQVGTLPRTSDKGTQIKRDTWTVSDMLKVLKPILHTDNSRELRVPQNNNVRNRLLKPERSV